MVAQLPAHPGDAVLDVGCGTGLCLPLLQRKVGPSGTIVGIDASTQMLDLARARVTEHGWDNVRLIAVPVAQAPIDRTADAALFCAVHDVLQSPAALTHVFEHLRPGAAVAATGGKWPPAWNVALRAWVADLHAPFINDFTGFDQPWRLLAGGDDTDRTLARGRTRIRSVRVRPRPAGDRAGLRRRLPGGRARPWPASVAHWGVGLRVTGRGSGSGPGRCRRERRCRASG